ncbi:MAG: hypothetical protein JOZ41_05965, partial [Chloroflexi bacterium]|nr:hypothetical protein [Chloroflexota bacterium]
MLAELDVLVFLKSGDTLDRVAGRVFGSLKSPYQLTTSEELGGSCYEASGLGFT